jgi:hypothetical protein
MTRRDAIQHRRLVTSTRHLRREPTNRALPHMPVRVHQTRNHKPPPRINHLNIRRRGNTRTDLSDNTITHKHITLNKITNTRINSHHITTPNKNVSRHDAQPPIVKKYGNETGW